MIVISLSTQIQNKEFVKHYDTCVILHLYYAEMWDEIRSYLLNLENQFDLIITSPSEIDISEHEISEDFPNAYIYRCENLGRDVLPFLLTLSAISSLNYKYICKIHTKQDVIIKDGINWRRDMLNKLLGSSKTVSLIKEAFDNHPDCGLIAPSGYVVPKELYWRDNVEKVITLGHNLNIPVNEIDFSFVAGTMFWFRPEAFSALTKNLNGLPLDFEPEDGQSNGALSHAYERFFGIVLNFYGYKILECDAESVKTPLISSQFSLLATNYERNDEVVESLKSHQAELQKEIIILKSQVVEKEQSVQTLKSQVTRSQKKIEALMTQVTNKNRTIAAILDSSSWKLTSPFRGVRSLISSIQKLIKKFVRRLASRVYRDMPIKQYQKSRLKDFALRYFKAILDDTLSSHTGQDSKSPTSLIFNFPPAVSQLINSHEMERLTERLISAYNAPLLQNPQVSIVIPVYNNLEFTMKCLLSIKDLDDKITYEVIVADDNSEDATTNVLERCRGIRYLRNENNIGFLMTCNKAVSLATGQHIVLLNNDTIVMNGWLDNLYKTFSQTANVGLVGSKLIFPNGKLQEAGGVIWADGSAKNYGWNDDPCHYIYNYVREADYVSGASIMFPKELWDSLGGFDVRYSPAYYEDVDLAFRIRQAGYKILYQPFSQLIHFEGTSNGTDLTSGIKSYQPINKKKFFDTWHEVIKPNGSPVETSDIAQRERFPKGRVLFIDDVTLQPDQNAGAVLSESYITALHDDGYAVTFLPHFDSRFKEDYTPSLQKKGIECVYRPYYRSMAEYLKQFGPNFDYVVISRGSVAEETIELVKEYAPQAKVIFNTIDLHFMRLERAAKLSKKVYDEKEAKRMRKVELDTIKIADCTLVVSQVEADLLNELLPQSIIKVVPFPADVFESDTREAERQDIVFLGGFRHPANIDAVLYFVKEIWPLITQSLPDAKFVIAGPDVPPEIQNLSSKSVVVLGFVKDLASLFRTAKLSVAPIRYGAGIKGKVITSLGYGVPCIASSIATEGIGLTPEENILIADTPSAFADAVSRVFNSSETWRSLSSQGLNFIQSNYSRSVIGAKLLAVFKEIS